MSLRFSLILPAAGGSRRVRRLDRRPLALSRRQNQPSPSEGGFCPRSLLFLCGPRNLAMGSPAAPLLIFASKRTCLVCALRFLGHLHLPDWRCQLNRSMQYHLLRSDSTFPEQKPLCPAVLHQTLTRTVFRLSQCSRTTLSYSGPVSGFRLVLRRPIETTALIRH